jgi:hypothetical protein
LGSSPLQALDITLQWDPNTEPNLGGYVLHLGLASRDYHQQIDVGNQTVFKVTDLDCSVVYYFAVTAYDTFREQESGFSNEVSTSIPCSSLGVAGIETPNRTTFNEIPISESINNPVVIAGVPTSHGADAGVVRLRNVGQDSFEITFHEWLYLDGSHTLEDIPFLTLDQGRYAMPDGSLWEIGTFNANGTGNWQRTYFESSFPSIPALFLTIQTFQGQDPVTVRARNVTRDSFEAALIEEEAGMESGHVSEVVAYLAIYSPQRSGTVTLGGERLPYLLQTRSVDDRFTPVLSHHLRVEEDQSLDTEIDHIDETLSILIVGDRIFAQDITSAGGDPIALRRLLPGYIAPMEWGVVDGPDDGWLKVPLAKRYASPVVVAKPVSTYGGQAGVVRIRNASADSFELKYSEWSYLDQAHTQEQVFYMVVEEGTTSIAGLTVQAGKLDSALLINEGWEQVNFPSSFSEAPAVFSSVQTFSGSQPVTTRNHNISTTYFQITMDEEEALRDGHLVETLGWIAIEKGGGLTLDNRDVIVFDDTTSSTSTVVNFGQTFVSRFPVLLSDLATTAGADTCFLRYQNLGPSNVSLFVQEEQSLDLEMNHVVEKVSVFAAY